jgi:hypothetical protein
MVYSQHTLLILVFAASCHAATAASELQNAPTHFRFTEHVHLEAASAAVKESLLQLRNRNAPALAVRGGAAFDESDESSESSAVSDTRPASSESVMAKFMSKVREMLNSLMSSWSSKSRTKPMSSAGDFAKAFKQRYGAVHPPFYTGSFSEATEAAGRANKFCLVLITSDAGGKRGKADDTLCRALTDSSVVDFIKEHFVLYAVAAGGPGGTDAVKRVSAKSLPFLGVVRTVAKTNKRAVVSLHHCSPPPGASGLCSWMSRLLVLNAALLEEDKQQHEKAEFESKLAR